MSTPAEDVAAYLERGRAELQKAGEGLGRTLAELNESIERAFRKPD